MIKSFGWYGEVANWLYRIAGDFRSLTFEAFPCPFADVLLHGRPDKFGCHSLVCAIYAGVAEVVHYLKDTFSPS